MEPRKAFDSIHVCIVKLHLAYVVPWYVLFESGINYAKGFCNYLRIVLRLVRICASRDQWAAHTQFKPAPKYQRFKVDILLRGSQILHWWWYECTQNGLVCTDMILMLTFSCELWLLSTGYWRPRRGLLANRGINPGGITWPWTTGTLPVFQHSETNIVIKNVVFKYVP